MSKVEPQKNLLFLEEEEWRIHIFPLLDDEPRFFQALNRWSIFITVLQQLSKVTFLAFLVLLHYLLPLTITGITLIFVPSY